ncbi:MAG: S-methyl-5-thioribose-1-phosphate isomerase, partial [Lysobacter sp.]|nr:S-methyl-5-thioribose-1-phosphate isomerase [Lysobacter sp.]
MTNTSFDFDRYDRVRPIRWTGDALELIDQRKLPFVVEYVRCQSSDEVAAAIHALTVRGAPAIGIAAAWGVVLAARELDAMDAAAAAIALEPAMFRLNAARPTAVNLAWALARMRRALLGAGADWREVLETTAHEIAAQDLAANRRMGALGAALIEPGSGVLTHCNTGSLATAGFGTALGVIRAGVAQGRIDQVYAGETRPWLQGARLTVWELQQDGIAPLLIADSAA